MGCIKEVEFIPEQWESLKGIYQGDDMVLRVVGRLLNLLKYDPYTHLHETALAKLKRTCT